MNCASDALAKQAKTLGGLSEDAIQLIILMLLCQWANKVKP